MLQCRMHLSQTLHPVSVYIFQNIHGKSLHASFMLLFTVSRLRPDTTVMKSFGLSFLWRLFSKRNASLSLSVVLVPLTPVLHWRCNCNFFSKGSWTCMTPRGVLSNVNLMMTTVREKNIQLSRLLSGEKDVLGHLLGDSGWRRSN